MMKRLFYSLFLITGLFLLLSTQVEASFNKGQGVYQNAGCNTRYYSYRYAIRKNLVDFFTKTYAKGRLKVQLCETEQYSNSYQAWVAQTDLYISETGAPAQLGIGNFSLEELNPKNEKYAHADITGSSSLNLTKTPFHETLVAQRIDSNSYSNGISKTVGSRFYGYFLDNLCNPNGFLCELGTVEFVGPSVTMK